MGCPPFQEPFLYGNVNRTYIFVSAVLGNTPQDDLFMSVQTQGGQESLSLSAAKEGAEVLLRSKGVRMPTKKRAYSSGVQDNVFVWSAIC